MLLQNKVRMGNKRLDCMCSIKNFSSKQKELQKRKDTVDGCSLRGRVEVYELRHCDNTPTWPPLQVCGEEEKQQQQKKKARTFFTASVRQSSCIGDRCYDLYPSASTFLRAESIADWTTSKRAFSSSHGARTVVV